MTAEQRVKKVYPDAMAWCAAGKMYAIFDNSKGIADDGYRLSNYVFGESYAWQDAATRIAKGTVLATYPDACYVHVTHLYNCHCIVIFPHGEPVNIGQSVFNEALAWEDAAGRIE